MTRLEVHALICDEIKDIYRRKNADYGNSFSTARKEIPCYTLGKLHDKFSRYKNLVQKGEHTAQTDEPIEDTLLDLANYAIMELTERAMDSLKMEENCNEME